MKTTFEQAFNFVDVSKEYIRRTENSKNLPKIIRDLTPEQIDCLETYYGRKLMYQNEEIERFIYALKKVCKRITMKTIPEFQNILVDNQIDLCEADEKMEPKKDEQGNLIFTKENMKKRNQFQLDASLRECIVEEYHATAIPENLTLEEKEVFAGFVIPSLKKVDQKQVMHN